MRFIPFVLVAVSWATFAQERQSGMTLAEFDKAKAVEIRSGSPKKHFRSHGLSYRQHETSLSFQFSDGVENKVSFYDISERSDQSILGRLVVYSSQNRLETLVLPNETSHKAVKEHFVADLKAKSLTNDGLGICVAFALSQTQPRSSTALAHPQEFCFPAETFVNLVDGTEKKISGIQAGDEITGIRANRVEKVIVNEGVFSLTRLLVRPNGQAWVSTRNESGLLSLEVTPNHPVLTLLGKKRVEDLHAGDWLFVRDAVTGRYLTAELTSIAPAFRTVDKVYHLQTEGGTYEAENIVVLNKH